MKTVAPHRLLRRTPSARLYPDGMSRVVLEDPKPIPQSLEYRLAQRYWKRHGVAPFSDGSVPYVINNSGWAPRAAAEVLLAAGLAQAGRLIVVEVAAGTALFARQALDHIRHVSQERSLDVYERLTWVCSDGAAETVAAWQERGQFCDHQGHVVLTTADAEDMSALSLPDGSVVGVIANYALDSFPAEVVRAGGERLHLQASILAAEADVEAWVGMPLDTIRRKASSDDADDLDSLLPLLDWLEVRAVFAPGDVAESNEALRAAQSAVAVVNVGALQFLEGALQRLHPGGFVLINDYGPTTPMGFEQQVFLHRFGSTFTAGLNFPHLDQWLAKRGCRVLKPSDDAQRAVHTRLAIVGDSEAVASAFAQWFSDPLYFEAGRLSAWVGRYIASGQLSEALDLYERHLRWCPTDWHQLAEAAQLLLQHFGQPQDALELANTARLLNPWSSSLVWNVYGSALFLTGALDEAEQAWQKAASIHPTDPCTWLNVAFLHAAKGQTEPALAAIAKGLACDRTGEVRAALLQKQSEVLSAQSQLRAGETDRMTRRHRSLADALRPLDAFD